MEYDVKKELILSKLDYVIGGLEGLSRDFDSEVLKDIIKELINIEKDVKEY